MATSKQINPSNSYVVRQALKKYDPVTNDYITWTGATPITVGFYEDALGVTGIAGLTGLAMSESTVQGTYYKVVSGTSLAALTTYAGETIYQIVTAGALNDLTVVTPLVVTEPRYV